ncbi:uncharacterized protein LOC118754988 [Rhagoletis pomonella]|uniref:uncharacterized protein LOC118754988 n=1 Tax=Rhagoletis pomonella TaxID=28610 RepID=UPI001785CD3D|nr:uncharacterized protein LOC118754988 [Rhagoletis pomonella]
MAGPIGSIYVCAISKPEYTSYTTHYHPAASCNNNSICSSANNSNNHTLCPHHQQQLQHNCNGSNNNLPVAATEAASQQIRRHTIISTTLSNYNNQQLAMAPRRASIAWEKPTATAPTTAATLTQTSAAGTGKHAPTANIYKPVKITLIGEPLKQWQWNAVGNGKTAATQSNGSNNTAISNGSDKVSVKCEAAGGSNINGKN